MSRWLKGLNPEQKRAVLLTEGPVLVLAGAGSGKTRVITHRVAHLLDRGVKGENILAMTFTNKAAGEMRERLLRMVGAPARAVTLSTFHSFGLNLLRTEASRRRGSRRFVIYDTSDQLACLRELCRHTRLGRSYDLGSILSRLSAYKNAFLAPEELPDSADPYDQAAAILYPRYLEMMGAYAARDFDDLVCEPVRLLEGSEACRKRWSSRFRYLLVDEYQDTNGSQLRLLRAIAGKMRNLCVVGDDDQSIYGWRGAEVKNILQFERDFPGAQVVHLPRNYRSVGAVLEVANQVIHQNPKRHPKQLLATRETGRPVRLVVAPDGDAEARWVADTIEEAVRRQHRRPSEVAVLYRSSILSRAFEQELRSRRIAYRVLGGTAFFDQKEVKDLAAYLRLFQNPNDEISLRRAIHTPPRGIGPQTLARLGTFAEKQGVPLSAALERAAEALEPGDRALKALSGFSSLLKRARTKLKPGAHLPAVVRSLVQEIGLVEDIQESAGSDQAAGRRLGAIQGFLAGLEGYCAGADRPTLQEFLGRIALEATEPDRDDEAGERITLSTLHGAKGLEFELVFLVGLEEGFLPHDRTLNPHESDHATGDIAEERRLCYVGITRAKDELVLSWAKERVLRGRLQKRALCRFLEAVPAGVLEVQDFTVPSSPEKAREMLSKIRENLAKSQAHRPETTGPRGGG